MIRLLYFSQEVTPMTNADIAEVIAVAARRNTVADITGVLVHSGGVFLQILEGTEQAVLSLYLRILQDKRHTDVEIMRVTPIVKRLFEDWSMASIEATPLEFNQVMKFKSENFALEEPHEFMDTMHRLLVILKQPRPAKAQ